MTLQLGARALRLERRSAYKEALADLKGRHTISKQLGRIFDLIRDGQWRTLQEIAHTTGDPESSISAQLRHLRKPRFGAYVVQKRRRGTPESGCFEYRLVMDGSEKR